MTLTLNWAGIFGLAALLALSSKAGAENWPQFRGPGRQGLSSEPEAPVRWGASENVAWKVEVPGEGWSSPIICGERVFLTTSTEGGSSCHVISIDRRTGKTLWDKVVFNQTPGRKEARNTYATPTPATDGKRVYACFGDGSFAALDFAGEILWTNRDYTFYGQHGLGTSPTLYGDLLLMARDGSSDGDDKTLGWQKPWDKSCILAIDVATGKERWKGMRGLSRISHGALNIWEHEGKAEIVSEAGDVVQGFDAKTGERLWSSTVVGEGKVPSVVIGDGLAFTAGGWGGKESIKAFRLGGSGEQGEKNLVWEQKKGMPKVPSMLYVKPYLYSVTDGGIAQCLNGESGDVVWRERLEGNYSASPVAVSGRTYFLNDDGETTVLEAGPQFQVLARNALAEKAQASIAVSQGQLFIRTERHLWCIGSTARPDDGLAGAWDFDEAKGDAAADSSGQSRPGKLTGAKWAEGRNGGSVDCKQDAVVIMPGAEAADAFANGITVAAWVNRRADGGWNTVASREVADGPSEYFGLAVVKNNALFSIDPDGAHYMNVKGDDEVPTGRWVHLTGTYDNSALKLYVDGRLVQSSPCTIPIRFHDGNPLVIGGNTNTQGKKWVDCFEGRIDQVRLYRRALTEAEVAKLAAP